MIFDSDIIELRERVDAAASLLKIAETARLGSDEKGALAMQALGYLRGPVARLDQELKQHADSEAYRLEQVRKLTNDA